MISLNPYQLPGTTVDMAKGDGSPTTQYYYLFRALFLRSGGQSGIPFTVGANLTAAGIGQSTALVLTNDFNEVLNGSGGVSLAALQPGQFQLVFNGLGSLNVYPAVNGQIDAIAANGPYSLANGKTQIFWCPKLLASGVALYRSLQLG